MKAKLWGGPKHDTYVDVEDYTKIINTIEIPPMQWKSYSDIKATETLDYTTHRYTRTQYDHGGVAIFIYSGS